MQRTIGRDRLGNIDDQMQPEIPHSNERVGMGEVRSYARRWIGDRRSLQSAGVMMPGIEEKRESRNSLSTREPRKTTLGTAVPALLTSGSVWKSRPPECLGGDGQSGISRSRPDPRRAGSERVGSLDPPIQVRALVPRWARGADSLIQVLQYCFGFPVSVPQENRRITQNEIRIRSKNSDVRRFDVRLVGAPRRYLLPIRSKSTLLMSYLVIPTSRENPKKLGGG